MTRGTKHDLWMENNAGRFNFENEGYGFNPLEAWHKKWLGVMSGVPAGGEAPPIDAELQGQQNFVNVARGEQLEPDGRYGPATEAAFKRYQEFLRSYGYTGDIDGIWGPNMQTAHNKYYLEWAGIQAPTAPTIPPYPLPVGYYFGPMEGPTESVSGYYSYTAELKSWQTRMAERGFSITPDGHYGPETRAVALEFQGKQGYTQDGLIGPETWNGAWTAPVVPSEPEKPPVVVPTPPPTGYVPTKKENPRNLPLQPPTYPGAKYGLQAPLGNGARGTKGNPPTQVEKVVDRAIEHWTGTDVFQYDWFSYDNSRSSCPTWYITLEGEVVEFIQFEMKPCLTGPEWNWRSVGWEIQKRPDGTVRSRLPVASLAGFAGWQDLPRYSGSVQVDP
jgi:peptidoglycan hydrolase-like protein with peptidoglycan-binding domain